MNVLAGDGYQIVQRQVQRAAQLHHQRLLRRAEGGLQVMGAVRSILTLFPPTPFAHGVDIEVQLASQHFDRLAAGANVLADGGRRSGFFVQMN